jgi:hypothetical protein
MARRDLRGTLALAICTVAFALSAPLGAQSALQAPSVPSVPRPVLSAAVAAPQPDPNDRLDRLTSRVDQLESRVDKTTGGVLAFLFGAFCALWAQNTKRSPWAWFLLGALFNVFTVLVRLVKNAQDQHPEVKSSKGALVLLVVLFVAVLTFVYARCRLMSRLSA